MKFRHSTKFLLISFGITINLFLGNCNTISGIEINEENKENEKYKIRSNRSDDCSTPIDCYTKAINALNLAKQTYYSAVDKIESIQKTLINYTDQKVNNSTLEVKAFAESIRDLLNTKISSVQESFDSKSNNINNSLHNQVCREVDTQCEDDGGGNFVFADRHLVGCNDNEFMKTWRWIRCNGNSIRVHYTCCRHP